MMTPDQLRSFCERFVVSFEKIAVALEGLNDTHKRIYERQFPQRSEVREAVVTRVPTEEDRIRETQGASNVPIGDWLADIEEEEENIGFREQEWISRHGS
jgi:hypothetical protein